MSSVHWKIRRDPFFSLLHARRGEEAVMQAGFFFDDDPDDARLDDVDWLSTPPPRRRPSGRGRPVVLVATGAFCPIHDGHIAMMHRARAAAEIAGFDVLGGYLSPGHDAYIRLKCGDAAIPASVRLAACARAAESTDWLSVDPWEALHRRVAVNYTDIVARLRAYLRANVAPNIDVLYVCGADNARFALAFEEDAGCIVVGRPGSEAELETWRARLGDNARILWTTGDHPAASRAIRAKTWIDDRKRRLLVRIEDARAVRTLGLEETRFSSFQRALVSRIARHHEHLRTARVETVASHDPATNDTPTISLDAMQPLPHAIGVSRLFALGGAQLLGHVPRPGSLPFAKQIASLPTGSYVLHEDDRMTGGTLAAVRALLPERIRITRTELAMVRELDEEVVDSRDFLLGADHGGLVVEMPDGSVARAPYLLPYVDPSARASLPSDDARAFSVDVWSLNEATFRGTDLVVGNLPMYARAPLRSFRDDTPLEEVCRWHIERLRSSIRRSS